MHSVGGFPRAELEARLLAREDPDHIATKLGLLSGDTVVRYARLFFDVADRLDYESPIRNVVFTEKIYLGLESGDEPILMKLLAYYGGTHVLAEFLWYLQTPRPPTPRRLRKASREEAQAVGGAGCWCVPGF